MNTRLRSLMTSLGLLVFGLTALRAARAGVRPHSASFRNSEVAVSGDATLHLRACATRPALVVLYGFRETSDMWEPLA